MCPINKNERYLTFNALCIEKTFLYIKNALMNAKKNILLSIVFCHLHAIVTEIVNRGVKIQNFQSNEERLKEPSHPKIGEKNELRKFTN